MPSTTDVVEFGCSSWARPASSCCWVTVFAPAGSRTAPLVANEIASAKLPKQVADPPTAAEPAGTDAETQCVLPPARRRLAGGAPCAAGIIQSRCDSE